MYSSIPYLMHVVRLYNIYSRLICYIRVKKVVYYDDNNNNSLIPIQYTV